MLLNGWRTVPFFILISGTLDPLSDADYKIVSHEKSAQMNSVGKDPLQQATNSGRGKAPVRTLEGLVAKLNGFDQAQVTYRLSDVSSYQAQLTYSKNLYPKWKKVRISFESGGILLHFTCLKESEPMDLTITTSLSQDPFPTLRIALSSD